MTSDERVPAVTRHTDRDAVVVRVAGDIDSDSAPALAAALEAARAADGERTVVDLSGTGFADSAILHVLLEADRAHRDRGGLLVVAGPFQEGVRRLFEVTGTARFLVLADDAERAMEVPRAVTER
ncbi:hypothetical protein GCM10010129_58770 [Streptomyces fumigatiscleroticus]|nr:hypothetical protein GCM10010129_58770 [Streptomyces fumigatiscleroticus]